MGMDDEEFMAQYKPRSNKSQKYEGMGKGDLTEAAMEKLMSRHSKHRAAPKRFVAHKRRVAPKRFEAHKLRVAPKRFEAHKRRVAPKRFEAHKRRVAPKHKAKSDKYVVKTKLSKSTSKHADLEEMGEGDLSEEAMNKLAAQSKVARK